MSTTVRGYPVYGDETGLWAVVDLGEGNTRTIPVSECHICGAPDFRGEQIELHGVSICNECADTIMNLKYHKHSGQYLTWENEEQRGRKAKRRSEWVSRARRNQLYERDGYRCRYCGGYQGLTLDHLLPVAQGGSHESENLVTCCKSCNSKKGARTPEEAGMSLLPPPETST